MLFEVSTSSSLCITLSDRYCLHTQLSGTDSQPIIHRRTTPMEGGVPGLGILSPRCQLIVASVIIKWPRKADPYVIIARAQTGPVQGSIVSLHYVS